MRSVAQACLLTASPYDVLRGVVKIQFHDNLFVRGVL